MNGKSSLNLGLALVALLTAALAPFGAAGQTHQKGQVAISEGHEQHKYPIILSEALSPGEHQLGSLELDDTHVKVSITAVVDKDGTVSDIKIGWPKEVEPELLSRTSHNVYSYGPGGLTAAGKAVCVNIHAGGHCDYCSTYSWFEVTTLKPISANAAASLPPPGNSK